MSRDVFTREEVALCREAMGKPAPRQALALIASGRAVVEISHDRRNVWLVEFDGELVQDPDFPDDRSRRCSLAGAWPLYRAGVIDQFGTITEAGRNLLKEGG